MSTRETGSEEGAGLSVLLTGGSGLIGSRLTELLLEEGFSVTHLSRREGVSGAVRVLKWDPSSGFADPRAFDGIDCIIHLAGANIGEKRWTGARKREIISSRTGSAELLLRMVKENNISLKAFISASATGYYGAVTGERIFREEDPPADDFTGRTCKLWEEAAMSFETLGIRTVIVRTPVVLARGRGALASLMQPARFGLAVRLGSGSQYFPWIHIDDLCRVYLKALRDETMRGAYNAAAPEHISHDTFVRTMAAIMKVPVFLPPVPAVLMKAVLGEMASLVTEGSRVSAEKLLGEGFEFRYSGVYEALNELI